MEEVKPSLNASWMEVLGSEFDQPYFQELKAFLVKERSAYQVYPKGSQIFSAFNYTPFDQVRVVILGQDPYHGPGQAHGLCFSVPEGIAVPPSLVNIFKELRTDLGCTPPASGNLISWAKQGVLLINATLTVRAGQAGSHQRRGWERFTDKAIFRLSMQRDNIVFLLWGAYAIAKAALIDDKRHLILTAPHPSPLSASRGFFGCRHFSQANTYLLNHNIPPVDWCL